LIRHKTVRGVYNRKGSMTKGGLLGRGKFRKKGDQKKLPSGKGSRAINLTPNSTSKA